MTSNNKLPSVQGIVRDDFACIILSLFYEWTQAGYWLVHNMG